MSTSYKLALAIGAIFKGESSEKKGRCVGTENIVKPKLGYNKKALTNVCKCFCFEGGPSWARTNDPLIMSQML